MNKERRELPLSAVHVVAALCGDYFRMKEELRRGHLSYQIQLSYYTHTTVILEEVEEALGLVGAQAEEMILDISRNQGYRASNLSGLIGRGRYSRAKTRAVRRIAERLYLVEET